MKLIILKDNLKTGLAVTERAISEQTNLPILKHVLIKTINNSISLSATNLELGINKFINGKIIENGGLTIPFQIFYNIISNIDSDRVNLESEKNVLTIKTDNYQAKIQGINEEEFPIIPKTQNNEPQIIVNSTIFKTAILEIINAAQISEIRPEISGVLLDFQITLIKLTATDSFRLGEKTIYDSQFTAKNKKGFKIIIPLKTIQEIIRIFPNETTIEIYIDQNQILFKTTDQELVSRLIDGQYPDYEQIIPKNIETEITLNTKRFLNAVRLVSSLSGKINDIKIKIKEGTKTLEVYSANQYLGENSYLIPIKIKKEETKELTFNWRYLHDGLKSIKSEILFLGINGDTKPVIIKNPDDASYFYILMPIKAA